MSKTDFENWINHFFKKTKAGMKIDNRLINHEKRIQKLENRQLVCNQSHIDLEMFGIKLFKAKLINATKGILISSIMIGLILLIIAHILT